MLNFLRDSRLGRGLLTVSFLAVLGVGLVLILAPLPSESCPLPLKLVVAPGEDGMGQLGFCLFEQEAVLPSRKPIQTPTGMCRDSRKDAEAALKDLQFNQGLEHQHCLRNMPGPFQRGVSTLQHAASRVARVVRFVLPV